MVTVTVRVATVTVAVHVAIVTVTVCVAIVTVAVCVAMVTVVDGNAPGELAGAGVSGPGHPQVRQVPQPPDRQHATRGVLRRGRRVL